MVLQLDGAELAVPLADPRPSRDEGAGSSSRAAAISNGLVRRASAPRAVRWVRAMMMRPLCDPSVIKITASG